MPTRDASSIDSPEILSVVFHPRKEFGNPFGAQAFEAIDFPVAPGVSIGGRFYAAEKDKLTILFFHGNGEIAADYDDIAGQYVSMGVNFMPVDYRGYGRSSGTPTVTAMLSDARSVLQQAMDWLAVRGYCQKIIVMGRSLGSASALEIALVHPDKIVGLIVESGFADTVGLVRRLGAWLPDQPDPLRQTEKIAGYHGPVLIIHGTDDVIIPVTDAEAQYRACPSTEKKLLRIKGAGHNDLLYVGFREYMQAISEFVQGLQGESRT